jgi:hypothetical protein
MIGNRRWQLANGALDAIDDANTAIWTYFEMVWPAGPGAQLLSVYGVFQAATIQQDGVIELRAAKENSKFKKVLEAILSENPVLARNRELRNQLVGHPAHRSRTDNPTVATFWRHLPNRSRLSAAIYDIGTGAFRHEDIDAKVMVEEQARLLTSILAPIENWALNPS